MMFSPESVKRARLIGEGVCVVVIALFIAWVGP